MYGLHEVGHVVVELAGVGDVSVRVVGAMAAQVGNKDGDASLLQGPGHAMHVFAAACGAVDEDGDLSVAGGVEAIGELSAIAGGVASDGGQAGEVHAAKRVGDRFEGLGLGEMAGADEHCGNGEQGHEVEQDAESDAFEDA